MSQVRIFTGSQASNQNDLGCGSRTYKEQETRSEIGKKEIWGKRHVHGPAKEDSVHEDLCALY